MRMIPKPGKVPTRPDSYRPVSLLEVPGKLLEKIVTKRLQDDLEGIKNLHPAQYGFRRGTGTAHAIAVVTETLPLTNQWAPAVTLSCEMYQRPAIRFTITDSSSRCR